MCRLLVASQKTFYSRQNIRCQLFRERNPSFLALGKITTIQSAWSGQGIFKAVFRNMTLNVTSFNEWGSDNLIRYSSAGTRLHTPHEWCSPCGGCGKLLVLRAEHLILDSTPGWARPYSGCGSAVARSVVLPVLLRWRWGSLRILYSRICGSQYVSLCHSMRWMSAAHLNNNL